MALTKKQEEGLKVAVQRFKNGEPYTVIAGYAGSGKSFLTRKIIDALNLREEQVYACSFTGKASFRLQEMGFPQAKTIHKLIYKCTFTSRGPIFNLMPKNKFGYPKIIVVDEISMVPDNLLKDLASFGIHILMLGDPGQLPPIGKNNGMLNKPHVFLDEIVRQEADNPIIQLADDVRHGRKITPFSNDKIIMLPKKEIELGMLLWADQVLCGLNATRAGFNKVMREALEFTNELPEPGEKIIVTKNDWNTVNDMETPLVNGMTGIVQESGDIIQSEMKQGLRMGRRMEYAYLSFTPDFGGGDFNIKYDALNLTSSGQLQSYIPESNYRNESGRIQQLEFAYAMTVHKFQGSEANNIVGIDEPMRGTDRLKWLYTMITRSKDKLVLGYDPNNPLWDLKK